MNPISSFGSGDEGSLCLRRRLFRAVAARLHCPATALAAALLLLLGAILLFGQAVPAENVAHLSFQSLIADPSNLASGSCFYRSDLDQLRCQVASIVTVISTIQAAIDKIPSTGGTVLIPAGTYTECGITLKSNLVLRGAGWGLNAAGQNDGAALIQCSSGDLFDIAGTVQNVIVSDLAAVSNSGGGHIFNFNNQLVSKVELRNLRLDQKNIGSSILSATGTTSAHGFFGNWIHKGDFQYADGSTVPAINISTFAVNQVVLEDFRITQATEALASTYAIRVESVNAAGAALAVAVRQITAEQNRGGIVDFQSVMDSEISGVGSYDLDTATPDNPLIRIKQGASGPVSQAVSLSHIFSLDGTSSVPDILIEADVGAQVRFPLIANRALWVKCGGTSSGYVVDIGNTVSNWQNCRRLSLSTQNQLGFETTDLSPSLPFRFRNGRVGDNDGYFLFDANGTVRGFIELSTGDLLWGGTAAAPNCRIKPDGTLRCNTLELTFTQAGVPASAGVLKLRNNTTIRARNFANTADLDIVNVSTTDVLTFGTSGGTIKLLSGSGGLQIAQGAGTPTITAANGAPAGACTTGSLYLRGDGGAATTLYVCEAGAWAAK